MAAEVAPAPKKQEPEKVFISWQAASRPFRPRGREFYIRLIAIAAVFGLILFLIDGVLPVILIVSLIFLFYILNTVEPEQVNYAITNYGIKVGAKLTEWGAMGRFWFANKYGREVLVIETANFPGRLEMFVDTKVKVDIKKYISDYLTHEEVPPSYIDKASGWFEKRLLGQKTS